MGAMAEPSTLLPAGGNVVGTISEKNIYSASFEKGKGNSTKNIDTRKTTCINVFMTLFAVTSRRQTHGSSII